MNLMKKSCAVLLFLGLILSMVSVTGAVSQNQIFTYSDPDWNKGNNSTADGLWKYEWFARETETFANMDWNAAGGYFEAQYQTASASDTHWYCRVRVNGTNLHPGAQADAVRTFLCPESGTVKVSVDLKRQSAPNPNGNTVRIMRNNEIVPIDGNNEILLDSTDVLSLSVTVDVVKGDSLRLMIGSQGNSSSDGVNVSGHRIQYLSGPNLTPEKPTVTVTCVGDSITEGMGTSGGLKGRNAYPAVLETLLDATGVADFVVNNCGKSGTTALETGDSPYKKTAEYRSSLQTDPDIVIICFGANDSKAANWNADRYEVDYQKLIMEYMNLESKPTVYLFYTTYVADQSKTGCRRDVIQSQILPIQDIIAEDLGLKIIDLNTLTKQNSTKYADGVHPNDELQSMMAEYVFNALCSEGAGGLSAKNATATVTMIDPAAQQNPSTDGGSSNSGTNSGTDSTTDSADASSDSGTDSSTDSKDSSSSTADNVDPNASKGGGKGWILWGSIALVLALAGAGVLVFFFLRKKA